MSVTLDHPAVASELQFHPSTAQIGAEVTGIAPRNELDPLTVARLREAQNPANSGDGYAMAYHAGAGLANLECSEINPLIKDYNGPSCAYVAGPFGEYTANAEGKRFIECDYWSGRMMPNNCMLGAFTNGAIAGEDAAAFAAETDLAAHDPAAVAVAQEILDCADMAACASLFRTESRWGLCHHRVDFPEKDNANWFCHPILSKIDGQMTCAKRRVARYIVPIEDGERDAYDRQRIARTA